MDGLTLLRSIRANHTELPVMMVTAHGTVAAAVDAMKAGASDFILKPLDREAFLYSTRKALTWARHFETTGGPIRPPSGMIGDSAAMRSCYALITKAARSNALVLLRGESGTGKELAARAVHEQSRRADRPFIKVHCAALPDNLLESELFGYERGAFTGATAQKPGRVDLANGGTLFLDEIGDITQTVQVKLLRLLQDNEYERLGGTVTLKADTRFVAATHRNLEELISSGDFREDLFYRLNVVPITLPPLRERREDIGMLVESFTTKLCEDHGLPAIVFAPDCIELLESQPWPGNVRQLVNLVERLVVLSDSDQIERVTVEQELGRNVQPSQAGVHVEPNRETLHASRRDAERDALLMALQKAKNNRTLAARILGVSRRTLYNKLAEHDLADWQP